MIIRKYLADFLATLIIVFRRFVFLLILPYRTMRQISQEKDPWPIFVIFIFAFIYFKFIYFIRYPFYPATLIFFIFLVNFSLTSGFFYFLARFYNPKIKFVSVALLFAYSLLPTFIWFYSTSLIYFVLPPPRSWSLTGQIFSIFYLAYSFSLLFWKIILVYLAIRFSSRANFYQICYQLLLYLIWFIPLAIFFYQFRFFRIPFI